MSNEPETLDVPHCSCPGGYYKCPNKIHGMPENWKRTPEEEQEEVRRVRVVREEGEHQ